MISFRSRALVVLATLAATWLTYPVAVATPPVPQARAQASATATLTVMTAGDSRSVSGLWQDAFCDRLAVTAGVTCDLRNVSVSGAACTYWPSRLPALLAQHHPDMVIFSCGTNDVDTSPAGRDATGTAVRLIFEIIHAFDPTIDIVPTLVQYSDPWAAPLAMVQSEPTINDVLYVNQGYYAVWTLATIDWQVIPATVTYLLSDQVDPNGTHPTPRGYGYMGEIAYWAIAPAKDWPASPVAPLCDLYGTRRGYLHQAYVPCLPGG